MRCGRRIDEHAVMTVLLSLALVAVFIAEIALGAAGNERALVPLGALITRGWSSTDWWRVFTFSFGHLNWLHLALNTAGLLWLGRFVERRAGRRPVLIVFSGSGVASGVAGMLLGPFLPTTGVAVGASGAICGQLAVAVVMAFHRDGDRGPRAALLICLVVIAGTSLLPGVSLAGHLGGLGGGAMLSLTRAVRTGAARSVDPG